MVFFSFVANEINAIVTAGSNNPRFLYRVGSILLVISWALKLQL